MKTPRSLHSVLLALVSLGTMAAPPVALAQTGERQEVKIRFRAAVGDQVFRCGEAYTLGKAERPMTASDFRFYVSEVTLVDEGGRAVPVELVQDGKWQYRNVALLDFENKAAPCSNGTADTRDVVLGTVPRGNYRGVQFTLGLPFALNHEDATLAPSPMNLTSLWWNWQGGYKFARIDLQEAAPAVQPAKGGSMEAMTQKGGTQKTGHGSMAGHGTGATAGMKGMKGMQGVDHGGGGFPIHLGSVGCQAASGNQKPSRCLYPNTARVVLKFDSTQDVVVADLGALLAGTDPSRNQPGSTPGCMAEPSDGDCATIMANLGLGASTTRGQTFFRVEPSAP